jgi:signal-transduction protein with cAMP-binding, CBS, and nucleotidyltransferase domain
MRVSPYAELKEQFSTDFCHSLSMFGALCDESLEFLLHEGRLCHCDTGDRLFSLGDYSEMFYVVLSGTVRFYQSKEEAGELVPLREYKVGEQIGFVGMIGLHQRRGSAVMEQPGYVLEVSAELFHRLCDRYPEAFKIFFINIAREMSREISHLDQMYVEKP